MAADALELQIGRSPGNWVRVQVFIRSHYGATEYWDANWLDCAVEVHAAPFTGTFSASLRTDEFERLRDGLKNAYEDLRLGATFESMEEWLSIEAKSDGLGHFSADCRAVAGPDRVNVRFGLEFDQTEIPEMLKRLDAILERFPVLWRQPDRPR